jgi:hypothetical protein
MSDIIIGSARHDEHGKYANGTAGDQAQKSTPDFSGEVSMQQFYIHKDGWFKAVAKNPSHLSKLAERMKACCNNPLIGYDQNNRLAIIKDGIDSKKSTECDCSSAVRACIIEATGKDPGNFTTYNEKKVLQATGLFDISDYQNGELLRSGTILCSKKKGHTVIVVQGNASEYASYYPKCKIDTTGLCSALESVGEKDTSFAHRKKIAMANGINPYQGTIKQNLQMIDLLKKGLLKKF